MKKLIADAASVFTPLTPASEHSTSCITCGEVSIPLTVMRVD